ncbi:hypothetical protein PPL_01051 [Heterostelium album PN500]|uniref:Uncharacterized protein n=1 Tax=Heterostelium pallidum (strain ATCC 26659 / Pp 5 / PN500) TaxID=670386 RepID=D3AXZ3_HETP5|nr:hypothetical protein PPL_01051 [Heterostelium album PN500]EFA85820.1 hypothetical protein PPL_01051 [Heterostelium album PN500]|eukprot:XP_020437926.1 hypothetical protein PPL_01051 [Heterostelium album PN500]
MYFGKYFLEKCECKKYSFHDTQNKSKNSRSLAPSFNNFIQGVLNSVKSDSDSNTKPVKSILYKDYSKLSERSGNKCKVLNLITTSVNILTMSEESSKSMKMYSKERDADGKRFFELVPIKNLALGNINTCFTDYLEKSKVDQVKYPLMGRSSFYSFVPDEMLN